MSSRSSSGERPAKKPKLKVASDTQKSSSTSYAEKFMVQRERQGSLIDFDFLKTRVRELSGSKLVPKDKAGILYWMSRDQRVQDNWAFLFAQKLALKNHLPLHVAFCLVPKFLDATIRQFKFLLDGLEEVERECRELNINFHLLLGQAGEQIPRFVQEEGIGAVVCDFSPLRVPMQWVGKVQKALPGDIPFVQVDAHNIVPVWVTSEKQEYAARTIRNKVNGQLGKYLTEFPAVQTHPYDAKVKTKAIDWQKAIRSLEVDRTVEEVKWARPGYKAAVSELQSFIEKRLKHFESKRNDPTVDALSNLSPWFHFGQLSVQRAILTVNKEKSRFQKSVEAFCEEAIVRRELSDNFCFFNKNYDNLNGLASWAAETLKQHRKDKRPYLYTEAELDEGKTHDDLWNAAQIQLKNSGKMHGFLRMYWAKKILEWTSTPEEALRIAIYFNDRYSLDGRDPNGYVGCMWSIGGIHDQGWAERAVFGKIRYMNYAGCKRKFDVAAFVARMGAKAFKK